MLCPFDFVTSEIPYNVYFHCLEWIWTNTSADLHWVKHWLWPENNSYIAFFKWKQAVSHLWLMNSPFQLASVIHRMKIFQETWRLLFLFYHFPLNVLCDRCVLFSTLDCWAYVMFWFFFSWNTSYKEIYLLAKLNLVWPSWWKWP